MADTTHLDALMLRLSHEKGYLAAAKGKTEIAIRKIWITQIEKEIAHEMDFLGGSVDAEVANMSDDDLLASLT